MNTLEMQKFSEALSRCVEAERLLKDVWTFMEKTDVGCMIDQMTYEEVVRFFDEQD